MGPDFIHEYIYWWDATGKWWKVGHGALVGAKEVTSSCTTLFSFPCLPQLPGSLELSSLLCPMIPQVFHLCSTTGPLPHNQATMDGKLRNWTKLTLSTHVALLRHFLRGVRNKKTSLGICVHLAPAASGAQFWSQSTELSDIEKIHCWCQGQSVHYCDFPRLAFFFF